MEHGHLHHISGSLDSIASGEWMWPSPSSETASATTVSLSLFSIPPSPSSPSPPPSDLAPGPSPNSYNSVFSDFDVVRASDEGIRLNFHHRRRPTPTNHLPTIVFRPTTSDHRLPSPTNHPPPPTKHLTPPVWFNFF
ncbi:hypothetical protein HanIR_Chr15g0755281 [Helianthus annuus]|uniref:lysine-rich arabinogalactan protein 19-like n=1 Tax=Helianthus annuus TaxID=4232 RepID=UPI000B9057D9|nr:lysine-rich arabinogalactan protein 19-like [Helianthus annuus]KAJ0455811.1 hypothetical protein HanIR_Chr15g0755281 [Helianthus annuus]